MSVQRVWPHDGPDGGAGQRDLGRRMPHVCPVGLSYTSDLQR